MLPKRHLANPLTLHLQPAHRATVGDSAHRGHAPHAVAPHCSCTSTASCPPAPAGVEVASFWRLAGLRPASCRCAKTSLLSSSVSSPAVSTSSLTDTPCRQSVHHQTRIIRRLVQGSAHLIIATATGAACTCRSKSCSSCQSSIQSQQHVSKGCARCQQSSDKVYKRQAHLARGRP